MQRTGKLKLKRKTVSEISIVETDYETKEEKCFSERIKVNPEDYTNCVTLISSSDEDQPSFRNTNAKTGVPSSENVQHCGKEVLCQGFLDVADIGVREIRQLVLQSRERYIQRPLVDLPPFPGQELEIKENSLTTRNSEAVLPSNENSEEILNELSPLPVMCDWCRRRKLVRYDLFEEEIYTKGNIPLTDVITRGKPTIYSTKKPHVKQQDLTNFNHVEKLLEAKSTGPLIKYENFFDDLPGNKLNDPIPMKKETYHDSEFSNDSFDLMEVEEGGDNPSQSRTNQGEGIPSMSERSFENRGNTAVTAGIFKGMDNSSRLTGTEGGDKPLESTGTANAIPQCCPLCQKKFDASMCQMAIDGHIAACFAASTDDVIW